MRALKMKSLLALALALSLAGSGAGLAGAAPSDPTETLARSARNWQLRGREDRAADAWAKLLVARPNDAEALAGLGRYRARTNQKAEARELLERLKAAHPSDPRIASLSRAIELGPDADAILARARAHAAADRPGEAVSEYQSLFGSKEPPGIYAFEYYQTLGGTADGWEAARAGLARLSRETGDPAVAVAAARLETYREETRRSGIERLRKLAESAPQSPAGAEALRAWKQALLWVGPADEALLNDYLASFPNDAAVRDRLASLRGHATGSSANSGQLEPLAPEDSPEGILAAALTALNRQDFARARDLLERVKSLAPNRPELWARPLQSARFWLAMRAGDAAREKGQFGDAEARYLSAVALSPPERHHAQLALANLALEKNQTAQAEPLLLAIMKGQPSWVPAKQALVRCWLAMGRAEEAKALNEELANLGQGGEAALSASEIDAEAMRLRARDLVQQGDLERAAEELEGARELDPENAWVVFDLANVELSRGHSSRAQQAVSLFREQEPDALEGVLLEARVLLAMGDASSALAVVESVPASTARTMTERGASPSGASQSRLTEDLKVLQRQLRFQVELEQIVSRGRRGGMTEAQRLLSIIERRPLLTVDEKAQIALAWADLGNGDRAVRSIRDAFATVTSPTVALRMQQALVFFRAEHDSELMEVLSDLEADDARLSNSDRDGVLRLRIALSVRRADRLREAGELSSAYREINPVLRRNPDNASLLCALGRLLLASSDNTAAREVFRRAIAADPASIEARRGAIEASQALQDSAEVNRLIEEGIKIAPDDPQMYLFAAREEVKHRRDRAAIQYLHQAQDMLESNARKKGGRSADEGTETANYLQVARRRFASTARRPQDGSVEREIAEELERIEARHRLSADGGITLRQRSGEEGLGKLTEIAVPVVGYLPIAYAGRLALRATPVMLTAGNPKGENQMLFGGLPTAGAIPSQDQSGTAVGLEYQYNGFAIDVGSSPLGFQFETVVGGASFRTQVNQVALLIEASRRSLTDSVLSYAGTHDPITGKEWGGVTTNGGRIDLAFVRPDALYYISGRYDAVLGTRVKNNQRASASVGGSYSLFRDEESRLEGGLGLTWMSFRENLSRFTMGHGGYFSPENFFHLGVPLRFVRGETWTLKLSAEPGLNWFHEKEALYFPAEPELQAKRWEERTFDPNLQAVFPAQTNQGFSFNFDGSLLWPISNGLNAGINFGLHTARDYRELFGGLTFSWTAPGSSGNVREPAPE